MSAWLGKMCGGNGVNAPFLPQYTNWPEYMPSATGISSLSVLNL